MLVKSVLDSGYSVEMNAEGYSMFPTFLPGSRIVVKPLATGEMPSEGSVVVFTEYRPEGQEDIDNTLSGDRDVIPGINSNQLKGRVILHRLINIADDGHDNRLFITRGDSLPLPDKPLLRDQIIGVAESYKRGSGIHSVVSYVPAEWRYKINRRLLWGYIRIIAVYKKIRALWH